MTFITEGKKFQLMRSIEKYVHYSSVDFLSVMSIPVKDRLPALIDTWSEHNIHLILITLLTDFCNNFNVVRPMTSEQIVSCAFELMKTSYEDYLAIEDFVLFFEGAKTGKYCNKDAKILDRIDTQVIFALFENYRQARHEARMNYIEEIHSNYKISGDSNRASDIISTKDLMKDAQIIYLRNK